jgi:hypothetical protein
MTCIVKLKDIYLKKVQPKVVILPIEYIPEINMPSASFENVSEIETETETEIQINIPSASFENIEDKVYVAENESENVIEEPVP